MGKAARNRAIRVVAFDLAVSVGAPRRIRKIARRIRKNQAPTHDVCHPVRRD